MVEHPGEERRARSGGPDHPKRRPWHSRMLVLFDRRNICGGLSSIHSYSVPVRTSAISSKLVRSLLRGVRRQFVEAAPAFPGRHRSDRRSTCTPLSDRSPRDPHTRGATQCVDPRRDATHFRRPFISSKAASRG